MSDSRRSLMFFLDRGRAPPTRRMFRGSGGGAPPGGERKGLMVQQPRRPGDQDTKSMSEQNARGPEDHEVQPLRASTVPAT
jgi:hypothetical protein